MGIPPPYSWRRASLDSTVPRHYGCHDHSKITGEPMLLACIATLSVAFPSDRPLALVSPYSFVYIPTPNQSLTWLSTLAFHVSRWRTFATYSQRIHYSHLLSLLSLM